MRISDWSSDVCSSDLDVGGQDSRAKLEHVGTAVTAAAVAPFGDDVLAIAGVEHKGVVAAIARQRVVATAAGQRVVAGPAIEPVIAGAARNRLAVLAAVEGVVAAVRQPRPGHDNRMGSDRAQTVRATWREMGCRKVEI